MPEGRTRKGQQSGPWPEERIRADLGMLFERRSTWPTGAEFAALGLRGLRRAVTDGRGVQAWAEEFGVSLSGYQDALVSEELSGEALEREALAAVAELGFVPGERALRRAGFAGLARAVVRAGGAEAFAQARGLPFRRSGRPARAAGGDPSAGPAS